MIKLNYLINFRLHQIFNIILSILSKKTIHLQIIFKSNIWKKSKKDRITSKIKTGYDLQLAMPEAMKLHESTDSRITGKCVLHLEITNVFLVHCIFAKDSQHDSKVPNKSFG